MLSVRKRLLALSLLILGLAGVYFVCRRGDADAVMNGGASLSEAVAFSVPTGHYERLPSVRLHKAADLPPRAQIYYTLDGSTPDESSHLYAGGSLFANVAQDVSGPSLYVLRASVCVDGRFSDPSEAVYLVGDLTADGRLPYVSLLCDKKELYDPADSVRAPVPGHVTVFSPDGDVLADQDVGLCTGDDMIVTSGTASVRILADYAYDPRHNKLPLSFPGQFPEAGRAAHVSGYKQLLLTCGGRDDLLYGGTKIRGAAAGRLASQTDFTGFLGSIPCVAFFNGIFYDIASLGECFSDSMLADRYHLADAAVCEHFSGPETEVLEDAGVADLFRADLTDAGNRAALEREVDMENYLACCALHVLLNRTDWPQADFLAWRCILPESRGAEGDGRLRFFLSRDALIYHSGRLHPFFDGCDENALSLLLSGEKYAEGSVFSNVMRSPEYRERFADLLAEYRADAFSAQNVREVILGAGDEIRDAARFWEGEADAEKLAGNTAAVADFSGTVLAETADLIPSLRSAAGESLSADGTSVTYSPAAADGLSAAEGALPKGLLIDEVYTKQEGDFFVLRNGGDVPVLLSDYYASDDAAAPHKYRLPGVTLLPGERLAVDGAKNPYSLGDYICNFSLRSGETLFLSAADGAVLDSFVIPRMTAEESVGRDPSDGSYVYYDNRGGRRRRAAEAGRMDPEAAAGRADLNGRTGRADPDKDDSGMYEAVSAASDSGEQLMRADANLILSREETGALSFSAAPGFYDEPFDLEILRGEGMEDGAVYYTLDGSVPDRTSALYTQPIRIEDATPHENVHSLRDDVSVGFRTEEIEEYTWMEAPGYTVPDYPVDKCTIVRAVWYDAQNVPHEVLSGSYFVGFGGKSAYADLAVVSLLTDPDNLFDYDTGIYVLGSIYDEYMAEGNAEENKNYLFWEANYHMRGSRWERPVCVQVFDESHTLVLSKDAGIRTQGNSSRGYVPRSFNLYARPRYDGTSFFAADLFGSGYLPKRFTLFAGGNDYVTVLHDYLLSSLLRDRRIATIAYRPCAVFLDGEYWGTYQIAEKQDAPYLQAHYGVHENNVVIIKDRWLRQSGQLEAGISSDLFLYDELLAFFEEHDMTDAADYAQACRLIDVDSCIDYYAALIYAARSMDWPNQNIALWRSREKGAGSYEDTRWRWMLFDVNSRGFTDDLTEHDTLSYVLERDVMFANLYRNDTFRAGFEDVLREMCDTVYAPERVDALIDSYYAKMTWQMAERNRRFFGTDATSFVVDAEKIRAFFQERGAFVLSHFIGDY